MNDPDESPNTLSGAVRVLPASEGAVVPATGSPLTPFSPLPADGNVGDLIRSSIVGRYPVSGSEDWTLIKLTEDQIQQIAEGYERLLAEKEALQTGSERMTEVLAFLRRATTRKNREWNEAIDTVARSLDET